MIFKANLWQTLPNGHKIHFIYAFDDRRMRKYYPFESDYAATVGASDSKFLVMETLMLHGRFQKEYLHVPDHLKLMNFNAVYSEIRTEFQLLAYW